MDALQEGPEVPGKAKGQAFTAVSYRAAKTIKERGEKTVNIRRNFKKVG